MATKRNLFRRRCAPFPIYLFCLEHEKSIEHALILCPWVDLVWFGVPLGLRVDKGAVTTLHAWLETVWQSLPSGVEEKRETMLCIAFLCWSIWKARCDGVFNSRLSSPSYTLLSIANASSTFLDAQSEVQLSGFQRGLVLGLGNLTHLESLGLMLMPVGNGLMVVVILGL